MILSKIKINNFRALKDIEIKFHNHTYLLGENNSGKSSLIDALKLVLTGSTSSRVNQVQKHDFYQFHTPSGELKISEQISIEITIQESHSGQWSDELVSILSEVIVESEDDTINYIFLRFECTYNEELEENEVEFDFLDFSKNPMILEKSEAFYRKLIRDYLVFFYLPALRDASSEFNFRSRFWGSILRSIEVEESLKNELISSISEINQRLYESDEKFSRIKTSLMHIKEVLGHGEDSDISINSIPLEPLDILKNAEIRYRENEVGVETILDRHGQGTQSLSVIFLFEAFSKIYLKKWKNEKGLSLDPIPILTVEEPEVHLHPHAVKSLSKYLSNIENQLIITTHSVFVLENVSFKDIRKFKKTSDGVKIFSIQSTYRVELAGHDIEALLSYIDGKANLEYKRTTKELHIKGDLPENYKNRIISFFDYDKDIVTKVENIYKRSKFNLNDHDIEQLDRYIGLSRVDTLYSNGWILVEGISDEFYIKAFAMSMGVDLNLNGISLITTAQKDTNVLIKLAHAFDIPIFLLSDHDDAYDSVKKILERLCLSDDKISELLYVFPDEGHDIEKYMLHNGLLEVFLKLSKLLNTREEHDDFSSVELYLDQNSKDKLVYENSSFRILRQPDTGDPVYEWDETESDTEFLDICYKMLKKNKTLLSQKLFQEIKFDNIEIKVPDIFSDLIESMVTVSKGDSNLR